MRSATTSLAATVVVAISLAVACAPLRRSSSAVPSGVPPAIFAARLAEADALAARGCYVCLREASAAYAGLTQSATGFDTFAMMKKALETDLMIAIREIELRIPDSGARQRADSIRQRVMGTFTTQFAILDVLATPLGARATTGEDLRQERAARSELLATLEADWPTNPVTAYYFLSLQLSFGSVSNTAFKAEVQKVAEAHPLNSSLRYRLVAYQPTFDAASAAGLLAAEPRFEEVRLAVGERAMFEGDLATARRELLAALETLPDSLAVKSALATVEFAYARYAEALQLFDEILSVGSDATAQLGKAEALSYLRRHRDAIAELDELLEDPSRNPGDKYYWRGWNRLQLGDLQPAYEDATAALRFMLGVDAYRLAGIASFALERLSESRGYFESALKIRPVDCVSIHYLGQLDLAERNWLAAFTRFSAAVGCFQESIANTSSEIAKKEAENASGLLDGQIARLRIDINTQQILQAQSSQNAAVASRNAGLPPR